MFRRSDAHDRPRLRARPSPAARPTVRSEDAGHDLPHPPAADLHRSRSSPSSALVEIAGARQYPRSLRARRNPARRRPRRAVPQGIRPPPRRDRARRQAHRRFRGRGQHRHRARLRAVRTTTPPRSPPPTDSTCWNSSRPTARSSPPRNGPRASATKRTGSRAATIGPRAAPSCGAKSCREGMTLALAAVRVVTAGDRKIYVVGGQQLDPRVPLHPGAAARHARAALARSRRSGRSRGPCPQLAPAHRAGEGEAARDDRHRRTAAPTPRPSTRCRSPGYDNSLLAVLLVGSSRRDLVQLEASLRTIGISVGRRRNPARHRAGLVGDGARHPARAAAGRERRQGRRRQLGRDGRRHPPPTRSGNSRAPSIA